MQIHALQTGSMDVKQNYVDAKGSNRVMRLTNVLLDDTFVTIPVYVWVIEHPEGIIVVDTGLVADMANIDYFPFIQRPYWGSQYRFRITEAEEVDNQLWRIGIRPQDVRWVILTHTHFDHSGGIHLFPNSEFILSEREHRDVQLFRSAHFAFPSKWPDWFKPNVITYRPEAVGPFQHSYALTKAGDIWIVPTPGHTMGHLSVIVQNTGTTFFLAADTSFNQESMFTQEIDAPAFNAPQDFETRQRILDYAHQVPLVYLTTHDPQTAQRLAQRTLLLPQAHAASHTPDSSKANVLHMKN